MVWELSVGSRECLLQHMVALPELLGSIPCSNKAARNCRYLQFWGSKALFLPQLYISHMWCTNIHAGKTPIHMKTINKMLKRDLLTCNHICKCLLSFKNFSFLFLCFCLCVFTDESSHVCRDDSECQGGYEGQRTMCVVLCIHLQNIFKRQHLSLAQKKSPNGLCSLAWESQGLALPSQCGVSEPHHLTFIN